MIPKRAIFTWVGPPMSWLRQQSIESFKRMNPSWDVRVVTSDWPEGPGFRFDVIRSDFARYKALYELGGVYFDTDIIFVRPIPDAMLEKTLCAHVGPSGKIEHIAVLGAVPGHEFFQKAMDACRHRLGSGVPLDCQAFGVRLLTKIPVSGSLSNIPNEVFLTVPWSNVEYVWNEDDLPVPAWSIGVHWYGGDRLSQDYEHSVSPETWPKSRHMVAKALRMSFANQPV